MSAPDRRKKPAPPANQLGLLGLVALGIGAAISIGVGYFIGKEEARQEAVSSGSTSSSTNPQLETNSTYEDEEEKQHTSDNDKDLHDCSVCLDRKACMVLVDCGHQTVCRSCLSRLKACPICSRPIKGRAVRVYKS